MLKKYVIILVAVLLCGCSATYRLPFPKPDPLLDKDEKNAAKMAQIVGNKHETTIILTEDELEFALQYPEYFADSVTKLGFKSVAIPFVNEDEADVETSRGKELFDFVMYLYSKDLKTFYLIRESSFINSRRGSRFVWGRGNPYRSTLLKLKEFWGQLPERAEMPTVIFALEMNRWNDRNVDRPRGLLFTWRKEKDQKGDSNDRLFCRSMEFFNDSCSILELEQVILMLDFEVVEAGEKGALTGGRLTDLLKKCDAVCVNMPPSADKDVMADKLRILSGIAEPGTIFPSVSPRTKDIGSYGNWLQSLYLWQHETAKLKSNAGIWVRDWNRLNKIWRLEK